MNIDLTQVRSCSATLIREMGCNYNDALPLLDETVVARSVEATIGRVLGMYCAAAVAYGFDRQLAVAWLERHKKAVEVTSAEELFLATGQGELEKFKIQIEAMWALCWCAGIVKKLDFTEPCAKDFITRLPDLKKDDSPDPFRAKANLRTDEEVVAACDLAYCTHWAVRDAELHGQPMPIRVPSYVITERRHALEWMLS